MDTLPCKAQADVEVTGGACMAPSGATQAFQHPQNPTATVPPHSHLTLKPGLRSRKRVIWALRARTRAATI